MLLAVDPAILRLPADVHAWARSMRSWERLLGDSPIQGSCPADAQTALLAHWGDFQAITDALRKAQSPLGYPDLLRIFESVRSRLVTDPLPEGHDVDLDAIACDPPYRDRSLGDQIPAAVEGHLARMAYQREQCDLSAGVATLKDSWAKNPDAVAIAARIRLREYPDGRLEEVLGDSGALRAVLHAWQEPLAAMRSLVEHPERLMAFLPLGVYVQWVAAMGGDPRCLRMEFGPDMAESLQRLNYGRQPRRAAALLRTVAMIAGGRGAEVPGHPARRGEGAGEPVLCDAAGFEVQRSYLAQRSPDAHRLFWIRRPTPYFLNVGGHDDGPIL